MYSQELWARFYDEPSPNGGSLSLIVILITIVAAIVYSKNNKKSTILLLCWGVLLKLCMCQ